MSEIDPTLVPILVMGGLWWVASAGAAAYAATAPRGAKQRPGQSAGPAVAEAKPTPAQKRRETAGQIGHGANVVAAATLAFGAKEQLGVSWGLFAAAVAIVAVAAVVAWAVLRMVSNHRGWRWLAGAVLVVVATAVTLAWIVPWLVASTQPGA